MFDNDFRRLNHAFPLIAAMVALLLLAIAVPRTCSAQSKPTPDQVLEMLRQGNQRFVDGTPVHPNTGTERLRQAGTEDQGDHAVATVLTCSDSRVPVERLFDMGIMDIFVIRVAGNVVKTDEAGSIEYGLAHVNTPVMVVLGHTQCGAVAAVTQAMMGHGHVLERNIPPLIAPIDPAVRKALQEYPGEDAATIVPHAIVNNVWQAVRDLFLMSPVTRTLHKSGKAKVVGAVYNVGTGQVEWLPESIVGDILAEVESNPMRATNPMAD